MLNRKTTDGKCQPTVKKQDKYYETRHAVRSHVSHCHLVGAAHDREQDLVSASTVCLSSIGIGEPRILVGNIRGRVHNLNVTSFESSLGFLLRYWLFSHVFVDQRPSRVAGHTMSFFIWDTCRHARIEFPEFYYFRSFLVNYQTSILSSNTVVENTVVILGAAPYTV